MQLSQTDILLLIIIILLFVNMAVTFLRSGRRGAEDSILNIRDDINEKLYYDAEENRRSRKELSEMLVRGQERMERSLKDSVASLEETNRRKLYDIQTDINSRLEVTLGERLDSSFKTVGDQLSKLYESLGEISRLEQGVSSLNKTLSNVKTRGIYGEVQLENILSDVLAPSMYDKNVVTRISEPGNREAVEFAVRIPDKETGGGFMYLPIDSKFPGAAYERIIRASEEADAKELSAAIRELETRIRQDAKDIRIKYIDPPNTTDFGIMFLPTESLYAEVLRIPGLVDELRSKEHIVITGPSTCTALINSLSIGFRYMAVNKDSQRILKLLGAIKTQYSYLSSLIQTADDRLEKARKATDELKHRTDMINRKLSSVEEMDPLEAERFIR